MMNTVEKVFNGDNELKRKGELKRIEGKQRVIEIALTW